MKSPQDMQIVMIEITNGCVNKCSNCTRFCGHHKKPFFMDEETFVKAVDSMQGFKGIVGIMGGEPTLHPKFARFVDHFRANYGVDDPSKSMRTPTKDFVGYIVKNVFDIDHHNQRGLWSSVGPKYAEHFERIQDTFGFQALNDHTNPSMHEALLVTRRELGVPDAEWIKLRDACWIQNIWSASITPKGAFFCEIAASMDMLLDGPGGWPIEPGWWKRKPEDFGDQLKWCELCSAPLAMPKRDAREGIDDVSPFWHEKLKAVGSPKLNKGGVKVFDLAQYNAADHQIINESLPYLHDHMQRIGESNRAIYPQHIAVVLRLLPTLDAPEALRMVQENCRNAGVAAVVSANPTHAAAAMAAGVAFLDTADKNGAAAFAELKTLVAPNDWVLLLDNAVASKSIMSCIGSLVFNPGCLYVGPDSSPAEKESRAGYAFFSLRARALAEGVDLCDLRASYSCGKIVPLEFDLNRKVKIYVSHQADAVRVENDILTPVHAGKALSHEDFGILGDDTGENISDKNRMYAELTTQYWAWKNDCESDYLGFMHYRRLFIFSKGHEAEINFEKDRVVIPGVSESSCVTYGWREADILEAMQGCDILLPFCFDVNAASLRNCREHCVHGHGEESLRVLLEVIAERYPDFAKYAEEFFAQNRMRLCNMFVMRRDLFHDYSAWLFAVLDEFVQRDDTSRYDACQIRMPAFLAERLFNIYLAKLIAENPALRVKEVPYALIENIRPAPKPVCAVTKAKPVVPVVTAFDAQYAPYFSVFLASMLDHISNANYYDLIVLEDNIPEKYKRSFAAMLGGRDNISIRYIDMTGDYGDKNAICAWYTKSTFYRLKLPALLPEYAKAAYIDPDVIAVRDVADLYNVDLANHYAGAVLDYTFKAMTNSQMRVGPKFGGTTVKEYLAKYLQLSQEATDKYFNAGVMVFNLEKMRAADICGVFERLYRIRPYFCPDQDILNKAFDGNILHVDPRWNVITQPLSQMKKAPYRYYKEYEATLAAPFLIHYAGPSKPWVDPRMDFAESFWEYCRKTPFYETLLFDAMNGHHGCSRNGNGHPHIAGAANGDGLGRYATSLKTTVSMALHRVSPALHARCRRIYHKIRN